MLRRTRKRRAEVIAELGGKCARCSSTERLEVDHIDPDTKVSHSFLTWSKKRQAEEMAKCQLLCRACHWQKTLAERGDRRNNRPKRARR